MSKHFDLYTHSREYARIFGEEEAWLESYLENCKCARMIELAVKDAYANNNRDVTSIAATLIEQFGYHRMQWVMSATVRAGEHDHRYSKDNRLWSHKTEIPSEEFNIHRNYTVSAHPCLVEPFATEIRDLCQELEVFGTEHCKQGELDYKGHVVVIRADVFPDKFRTRTNQLFYATGGNGCNPKALGTKVYGQFLDNGEKSYFHRGEIIGILEDEHLPEWAREALAEMQTPTDMDEPK